jgi:hypothetical protein
MEGIRGAVESGATEIPIRVNDRKILTRLNISGRQRRILLAGGVLNLAKAKAPAAEYERVS